MASFESFEPIFGEPKPERTNSGSDLLRRCLFHVYASDSHHLTVHVTDFVSASWEAVLSVSQVDDMRDTVGIGGSWSEFVAYMIASLKSDNVKLILDISNGVEAARLVSQKAKGMPRVTINLKLIVGSSASEAMANLSLELFKSFRAIQHSLEGERTSVVSRRVCMKANADDQQSGRETIERSSLDEPYNSVQLTGNGQDSPAKQTAKNVSSTKATKRVPTYRRVRKRGARLQEDSEEEKD